MTNRADQIDTVSKKINLSKSTKNSVEAKAEGVYIRGFGNTYSMVNAIAGKNIAEELDTEPMELNRNTVYFTKTKQFYNKVADIFGLNSAQEGMGKYYDMLGEKFEITDKDGVSFDLSKPEVMDVYNSIKNDNVRERYFNQFGQDNVLNLINNLSPQEQEVADFMMDDIKSFYPIFNKDHIRIVTG